METGDRFTRFLIIIPDIAPHLLAALQPVENNEDYHPSSVPPEGKVSLGINSMNQFIAQAMLLIISQNEMEGSACGNLLIKELWAMKKARMIRGRSSPLFWLVP